MYRTILLTLSLAFVLFLGWMEPSYGQSVNGYEKTIIFSGYAPDQTQLIFYFTIKGERASSASAEFIPQGDHDKAKHLNLYLLGKGSPFAKWKGIKLSADAPKDTTPQEVMYLMADADTDRLYLSDYAGHIITVLDWHYEGPVNGRGTACTTCLGKLEAFQAFRRYFLNG
ncbi:hypothetical protein [Fibrella aestuarina]|uniref:hypothetical protein n=1 Tax=Fibrella aestuarina TaxID=651143 RepID=UPI00059E5B3D|nr:hypothetical protein [Fibrella aestuarina]